MSDPLREPNLSLLVILSNMGVNVCPRLATNEGSNKRKMRGLNKKEKKRAAYHAGAEGGACVGSTDELLIAQSLLAVIKTGGFKSKFLFESFHRIPTSGGAYRVPKFYLLYNLPPINDLKLI
eukprot:COSAG06_NODE_1720_length_8590_cov_12.038865_3_plen_122_part_00